MAFLFLIGIHNFVELGKIGWPWKDNPLCLQVLTQSFLNLFQKTMTFCETHEEIDVFAKGYHLTLFGNYLQ